MRKNTARHWLHACLDLLPVLLIPVFMIYSHRHTIDSGTIDVPVNKVVDFNQLVSSKNDTLPSEVNGINISANNDGSYTIDGTSTAQIDFVVYWGYSTITNDKYLVRDYENNPNISVCFNGDLSNTNSILLGGQFNCTLTIASGITFNNYNYKANLYDLTKMFGSGNEPTYSEFIDYYPDYYTYVESRIELLKDYDTITYSDTDIMSQFTYQMYNAVDKYFNMGNVFGMSNVYDWFVLNIFAGNASISIYIVWNIVLYEFVMDLLFLLYALFMWFIDVTKRLIEKPLDSIK